MMSPACSRPTMSVFQIALAAAATCIALAAPARGAQVADPQITASADPFGVGFVAANVFDTGTAEFATSTNGAGTAFSTDPNNGTWIEFDFQSAVTIDTFINRTRANGADVIGNSRLIFSNDATFDASDSIVLFKSGANSNGVGSQGNGFIRRFTPQTARYVRWEVVTSIGSSQNLGARQMMFLDSPDDRGIVVNPTVIASSPAFSGSYVAANSVNGNAGGGVGGFGNDYASAGAGAAMFVDYDFGSRQLLSGFDFVNREVDHVANYTLTFANDAAFTQIVATHSFTADTNNNRVNTGLFDPVLARYVRFEADTFTTSANTGISNLQFYSPKLAAPSVVSVNSEFPSGSRYIVGHLFDTQLDANANADWAVNAGAVANTGVVVVDFGEVVTLTGINYASRRDTGNDFADLPSTILLEFSMTNSFAGAPSVLLNAIQNTELNAYGFDYQWAQFVRITIVGVNGGNVGGSQLEFLGVTGIVPAPAALPAGLALLGVIAMRRRAN